MYIFVAIKKLSSYRNIDLKEQVYKYGFGKEHRPALHDLSHI
jgi:hypothetical protein